MWKAKLWLRIILPRRRMWVVKIRGPIMEPWGTPQSKETTLEHWPSIETWLYRFDIYDRNQARGGVFTPRPVSSVWKRMLWLIVSNVAVRSSITKSTILFLSNSHRMLLRTFNSALSVLWPLRYADCMVSFISWLFKKSLKFDATTLSITLAINGILETGL